MKIRRLEIGGFGKLRGTIELAPERCNLILAPNESGKSTLIAALITALYGLPPERRSKHNPIPAKEAYRPWGGDPYGLTVDLTLGDEMFTIRRHLGEDRDEILEGRTGKDIAEQFHGGGGRTEFLEQKLGLERDDFARSALVLQHDVQSIRDGGDITLRLQKFASSQVGDSTAGEAVACLERALTRYEGARLAGRGRVETEIKRLDDRLAEVRSRRASLSDEYDAAGTEVASLADLGAREEQLATDLHRLDYLRTGAIISDLDLQIEDNGHAAERLTSLREERDSLAGYASFPVEAEKEMTDLKGEADQLAGRLAEARAALARDAEGPLAEVRRELDGFKPLLEVPPEDADALEAISVRLRDHRNQLKKSRNRARKERRPAIHRGVPRTGSGAGSEDTRVHRRRRGQAQEAEGGEDRLSTAMDRRVGRRPAPGGGRSDLAETRLPGAVGRPRGRGDPGSRDLPPHPPAARGSGGTREADPLADGDRALGDPGPGGDAPRRPRLPGRGRDGVGPAGAGRSRSGIRRARRARGGVPKDRDRAPGDEGRGLRGARPRRATGVGAGGAAAGRGGSARRPA